MPNEDGMIRPYPSTTLLAIPLRRADECRLLGRQSNQGSNWDSVEVGAESDAIHTRHLAYVVDMIGDHRDGYDRRNVGFFPFGHRDLGAFRLPYIEAVVRR